MAQTADLRHKRLIQATGIASISQWPDDSRCEGLIGLNHIQLEKRETGAHGTRSEAHPAYLFCVHKVCVFVSVYKVCVFVSGVWSLCLFFVSALCLVCVLC